MKRPLDPDSTPKRRLKSGEKQIWDHVARTVSPRKKPKGKGSAKALEGPTRDDFANMLRLPVSERASPRGNLPDLERNHDKRVRRGRINIEAKIDLHDMSQKVARPALAQAILRASKAQKSCLLVITGKGIRGEGVLRRNLSIWLEDPTIRPLIASYAPAHIRHGGGGAFYVFLKR